jgi:hypothetical protein
MMPVPLELEDGVDEVLEQARPGQFTALCHMPDEEGGDPPRLAQPDDRGRAGGDLLGRAR